MNILKIPPVFSTPWKWQFTQSAWSSLGNFRFQLPRFEATFLSRTQNGKPLMDMAGSIEIKGFNFRKSLQLSKFASYVR